MKKNFDFRIIFLDRFGYQIDVNYSDITMVMADISGNAQIYTKQYGIITTVNTIKEVLDSIEGFYGQD